MIVSAPVGVPYRGDRPAWKRGALGKLTAPPARLEAPKRPRTMWGMSPGRVWSGRRGRAIEARRASAADLKFLHHAASTFRNFKSKRGTRTMDLLVPFA